MSSNAAEQSNTVTLGILFAVGLCFWTSLAALLPTLPLYIQDVGGSTEAIGLVMGAFAIGLLGSRSWLGQLADRHSRKRVLLIGIAVTAIASLSYIFVQNITLLFCLRAFHGICLAAFGTAYNALVVDLAPPAQRGRLLGYMTLVNPMGVAVGPALGGILQAKMGYIPLFLTSTGLAIAGYLCALKVEDPMLTEKSTGTQRDVVLQNKPSFWTPLQERAFLIPALILLLVGIGFGSIASFVPLFMRQVVPTLNPGTFYTAAAIASFMIRLVVGKASDRFGRGLFISLGLLFYGISLGLLSTADKEGLFLAAGFCEGCGGGILIPIMAALIADRSPENVRGSLFSLCMAGFDVGIAIAGPILGIVAKQVGYPQLYGFTTVGMGVAMLIFITGSNPTIGRSIAFAIGYAKDEYTYSTSK